MTARLNDKHSEVRKVTCISLGQLGAVASSAVPLICLCLKDQHMDVVAAAQKALDELQPYRRSANTPRKSFEESMCDASRRGRCTAAARDRSKSRGREDRSSSKNKEKKD